MNKKATELFGNKHVQLKTTVVNINHDSYDVYIGRPGKGASGYFGNPIPLTNSQQRGATLESFKEYFLNRIETDIEFKSRVLDLRGKVLGCFCKPKPCHGDIIAEYLNNY